MTIEQLIVVEERYIQQRLVGLENIDFVGLLMDNGLTPESYAYLKAEHFLKTFNPILIVADVKLNNENFEFERVAKRKNTIVCGMPKERIVWYPTNGDFNRQYCIDNNIIHKERPYSGGVLCVQPSDLQVGIIAVDAPPMLAKVVMDRVVLWIERGTDAEVSTDGNDILVDGRKVYGMYNLVHQGVTVVGFNVTFDVDLDFIRSVCTKEMIKVPAGLNEFGPFDREELIIEISSWLR